MFRKNYLPKVHIKKDFEAEKWFAYVPNDYWDKSFCKTECGGYVFVSLDAPTKFATLDDLIAALYEYAYTKHLEAMKENLTYNSVSIKT